MYIGKPLPERPARLRYVTSFSSTPQVGVKSDTASNRENAMSGAVRPPHYATVRRLILMGANDQSFTEPGSQMRRRLSSVVNRSSRLSRVLDDIRSKRKRSQFNAKNAVAGLSSSPTFVRERLRHHSLWLGERGYWTNSFLIRSGHSIEIFSRRDRR